MGAVSDFYRLSVKVLLVAIIPSLILLGLFRNSPAHNKGLYLWLLPVIGFAAARMALLGLIDASSFDGTLPRYLNTIAGPLVIAAIVLNAQAIAVVRERFRRSRASI